MMDPLLSLIFISASVLAIFILAVRLRLVIRQQQVLKERNREMELKLNSYELESIRHKLNPHLFKNTLNAILSTAYQTYNSLDKLADILDYILYESDKKLVILKEEIEFAHKLVEINRLKISPLFEIQLKNRVVQPEDQKLVVPLVTVDLIENAFKHADLQSPEAFISIVFETKKDTFVLSVSNKVSKGPVLKKEHSGIGTDNFEKKLKILYKEHYVLKRYVENDIYIAQLTLPLFDNKDQMHIT